jgi:hypothetical protein
VLALRASPLTVCGMNIPQTNEELEAYALEIFPLVQVRTLVEDFSQWAEPTDEDLALLEALNTGDGDEDSANAMFDALEALESVDSGMQFLEMELQFHL